jgi:hypothetical protein
MSYKVKINLVNSFLSPEHKNEFANWLLSLDIEDLVKDEFNGYEFRKEFKTPGELYNEWYNNIKNE